MFIETFGKTWVEIMIEVELDSLELEEAGLSRAIVAIEWILKGLRIHIFIVFAFSWGGSNQIGRFPSQLNTLQDLCSPWKPIFLYPPAFYGSGE